MASPSQGKAQDQGRRRPASPAERAEEAHTVQLRLKQEAADRRKQAEASAKSPKRPG
jgi:hypothetical protein